MELGASHVWQAEPSVERERAITPVLKSCFNASAALNAVVRQLIGLGVSMPRLLRFWIGTMTCIAFVGFALSILTSKSFSNLNQCPRRLQWSVKLLTRSSKSLGNRDRQGRVELRLICRWTTRQSHFSKLVFSARPRESRTVSQFCICRLTLALSKVDSSMQRYGPIVFPLALAFAAAFWSGILHFPGRASQRP